VYSLRVAYCSKSGLFSAGSGGEYPFVFNTLTISLSMAFSVSSRSFPFNIPRQT